MNCSKLALPLVICLCGIVSLGAAQKFKCNAKDEKDMDELVARIMTFGTDRKFPVNKNHLKEYCKEQTRLVARLETYKSQCLKGEARNIVSVIIYSIKSITNTYCKHPNSKRVADLLNSANCANAATNDYNKCSGEYIDRLMYGFTLKDAKERHIQGCCGYYRISHCVREQAAKYPKDCSEEKVEANVNYIRGFFDNAVDTICGEYNDSTDKCEKAKLGTPKKIKSKKRPRSFFNPLVKLLSGL